MKDRTQKIIHRKRHK